MKDYDESLAFLGQWGRFQQIVFFLLCASILPNGSGVFSIIFVADTPSHHCLVPQDNLTQDWRDATIPIEVVDGKQERSRCSRYRLAVVRNLSAHGLIPGRDVDLTDLEQEGCVDGWSYSKDIYESTIVSEFNLVCSNQWKQPFTSTIYFIGLLFGSFFSGQISDRFGRKLVLFATMAIQTVFTFAQIFSPSWTVFSILLFLNGLGQISNYIAGFVLGTEILTGNVRVLFSSMGVCLGFAAGYMLLPLLAYFLRDWKYLLLGISAPGLVYIPLWWFIPESPRWLLSQGRAEEAEAIVRKAAKINKVRAPPAIFEDDSSLTHEEKSLPKNRSNILHLLKTRNIRNITTIVCLLCITLYAGYYGVSLNTSQLHADPYLSCFLSAAVEVPAYIFSFLAARFLPRRLTLFCILLVGALALYFTPLVSESMPYLAVALVMLGKFSLTACSAVTYVYTAEVYPTVLRNTAAGLSSTVSRVGSCSAPFLLNLRLYSKYLPNSIFGTMCVLSAFMILFLPETFGTPLPQTIQEMRKSDCTLCPCVTRKEHSAPGVIL